jgi:uncharacterized protein (TIGR04255 family)
MVDDLKPLYPNQQLQSVSLCTYFSGRASALTGLSDVQREFDDRFPRLYVPHAVHGQATSLQPYQLRSGDNGRQEALAVAVNQATYISFEYPGYPTFSREACGVLARTYEIINVMQLLRVEYRYENLIAVERLQGVLSLDKIARPLVPSGCSTDQGLVALRTEWRAKWSKGVLGIAAIVEEEGGVDVLRLIISAVCDPAGAVTQLEGFASDAHGQARACFESIITDEFRDVLKGGSE